MFDRVGQNRRYGSDLTRAAIAEAALRPTPVGLTEAQIGGPIREAKAPIPVVAWVPFIERDVQLDAYAIAWTSRAVQIEFELRAGSRHCVWVWAGAVESTGQ